MNSVSYESRRDESQFRLIDFFDVMNNLMINTKLYWRNISKSNKAFNFVLTFN